MKIKQLLHYMNCNSTCKVIIYNNPKHTHEEISKYLLINECYPDDGNNTISSFAVIDNELRIYVK